MAIPALAAKIGRIGKCVATRFADRYVGELTASAQVIPRRALAAIADNRPVAQSMLCFDNAVAIGDWQPAALREPISLDITFTHDSPPHDARDKTCHSAIDADIRQVYELIADASKTNTIKMGDIFVTPFYRLATSVAPATSLKISLSNSDQAQLAINFK